jgi:hypothetical protein
MRFFSTFPKKGAKTTKENFKFKKSREVPDINFRETWEHFVATENIIFKQTFLLQNQFFFYKINLADFWTS